MSNMFEFWEAHCAHNVFLIPLFQKYRSKTEETKSLLHGN